jgi:hypothetical protein
MRWLSCALVNAMWLTSVIRSENYQHHYHLHTNPLPPGGNLLYSCSPCKPRSAGTSRLSDHGLYSLTFSQYIVYELRHDKTIIMGLRPAWIQTSLRLETLLQERKLIENSMDLDQTARMYTCIC